MRKGTTGGSSEVRALKNAIETLGESSRLETGCAQIGIPIMPRDSGGGEAEGGGGG